jgi:hypothetical protein
MCGSLGQILTILMTITRFSTCNRHCYKTINTLARLNTIFVSIYGLGMLRKCLVINATFGNYPSKLHHKIKGFSHAIGNNLMNKDNSQMIKVFDKILKRMLQPQTCYFHFKVLHHD